MKEKERWKNNKSRNDHSAEETNTQMDLSGSADCGELELTPLFFYCLNNFFFYLLTWAVSVLEPREILFTSGALGANTDAADYLM